MVNSNELFFFLTKNISYCRKHLHEYDSKCVNSFIEETIIFTIQRVSCMLLINTS